MLHSDKVVYNNKEYKVIGLTDPDNGLVIIQRRVFGKKITLRVEVDDLEDSNSTSAL